jgi:hypothetical protein
VLEAGTWSVCGEPTTHLEVRNVLGASQNFGYPGLIDLLHLVRSNKDHKENSKVLRIRPQAELSSLFSIYLQLFWFYIGPVISFLFTSVSS